MNMNHGPAESKCCDHAPEPSAHDQFLDRLDAALTCQLQLCVAARVILDNFGKLEPMRDDPQVAALYGVISGIAASARQAAEEIDFANTEAFMKAAFGGRA